MQTNDYYVHMINKIRRGPKKDRERHFETLLRETKGYREFFFTKHNLPVHVSKEDAEAQLDFKLKQAIDEYDVSKGNFLSFLGMLVRAELTNIWNKSQKFKVLVNDSALRLDYVLDNGKRVSESIANPNSENPIEALIAQEEEEIKQRNLNRYFQLLDKFLVLAPTEQQVLLGVRRGESCKEMTDRLHIKPKAIDNALERIKSKIRKLALQGIEPDEIE